MSLDNTYIITVISIYFYFFIPALAMMVEEYVKTLNIPGAVPCIQTTWQIYVHTKCSNALSSCMELYRKEMEKQLAEVSFPCDDKKIRQIHREASDLSQQHFEFETLGMELENTWSYMRELAVRTAHISRLLYFLL